MRQCKCGHQSFEHYAEEYVHGPFACSRWNIGCRCDGFEEESNLDIAKRQLSHIGKPHEDGEANQR